MTIKLIGIRLPATGGIGSDGGVSPSPGGGVSPSGSGSTWPTWRQGLTLGAFSSISGTGSMSGIPVLAATIDAWCGLVAAGSSWFSALNGGHADSSQNKVCGIDLSQNAPAWTIRHNGSTVVAANTPYYSDGLPASRHTGYNLQYVAQRNRIMAMGSWGIYSPSGNSAFPNVDGYNLLTNTWDPAGTYASSPVNDQVTGVCSDPATGDCYTSGGTNYVNTLWKWTQATNAWSSGPWAAWNSTPPAYPDNPPSRYLRDYTNRALMVDPVRNAVVGFFDQPGSNWLQRISIAIPTVTTIVLSTEIVATAPSYAGMVYDPDNDRYVIAVGAGLYGVHPTTGVVTTLASITPGVNGVYTRLAYFAALGGIAYLPNFTSTIQFMPTRTTP